MQNDWAAGASQRGRSLMADQGLELRRRLTVPGCKLPVIFIHDRDRSRRHSAAKHLNSAALHICESHSRQNCCWTQSIRFRTMNSSAFSSAGADTGYRYLVERAEHLALADIDHPLHISALCLALDVSQRTLRKAFHKICGLPPCRRLRMLRLDQARQALLSADSEPATVTEIATQFGFLELGRFSVEYRKTFGESPSQTRYRSCRTDKPARQHNVATVRHRLEMIAAPKPANRVSAEQD